MNFTLVLGLVIVAALGGLAYAAFNYFSVKKLEEGTERMQEIASAIRVGANAFITYEYKIVAIVAVVVALLLALIISWSSAVAFIIGAVMSASAGWVGMKIATYANVRVTNTARTTKSLSDTLKVAFKGGSVMGLCVSGCALLGIFIVFVIFGVALGQIDAEVVHEQVSSCKSILGMISENLNFGAGFTMTLSGYALGCSIIAIFARIGGGIYTKGADLVGKTEEHIPEDDPRNPATIADNVGDNVGDVAGLGSDLLESYVGALLSGTILAIELFAKSVFGGTELLKAMIYFPLVFAAAGLISCIIGIASLFIRRKLSDNPHKELNGATYISAILTMIFGAIIAYFSFSQFGGQTITDELGNTLSVYDSVEFHIGWISPWVAAAIGIVAGIAIGKIAEYYTSYDYKPTKVLSSASIEGSALTITQGLALGMISCMLPCVVLGVAIYGSYLLSGMYGVAAAAIGMLSFVATTVSVDAYGPISDNAGGIAEMSFLEPEVREITDELDAVGNTTAAIGKGFAIGSAALATLSMMTSYIFAYTPAPEVSNFTEGALDKIALNVIEPAVLVGAIVGAALPFMFSGMLINAVAKAARKMVEEVRRQFREIKGLREGEVLPDYKTCIEISSQGALREMRVPAIFCIAFPVVCGFVFGAEFVGGVLVGATISAIMLALFCGNSGGAWDNGKKYIEVGGVEGQAKGGSAHDAAVVGDTVGDPLKDTVGPSLDILIKIMSTISLVTVAAFAENNLLNLLGL